MHNLFLHAEHAHEGDFWSAMAHGAVDALKDGLWSLPILFLAYLLMELLERSKRLDESVLHGYSRKAGPLLGGLLGIVPQCGISGAAATLFSTGSITVGTMLAVFFATSDEMLPILLSALVDKSVPLSRVIWIVAGKAVLGILLGYLADLLLRRIIRSGKNIHSFCEREHCACDEEEGNVFVSALKHTLKIGIMLIGVNFILNVLFAWVGTENLSASFLTAPVIGVIFTAFFGLIPNCSVSVVLTQSYLSGVIGIGGLFAGLLSNAGIGLLVLLRSNKSHRENLIITATLFALSALTGIVLSVLF